MATVIVENKISGSTCVHCEVKKGFAEGECVRKSTGSFVAKKDNDLLRRDAQYISSALLGLHVQA